MSLIKKRNGTSKIVRWWRSFSEYPQACWIFSVIWLLFITWIAFLWHLGDVGLVDETEPLFAEAARQMDVTGNWITPYFDGETRFDKPPLVYWLMAIGYRLIGVNEWAVRLPSALAAIALVLGVFITLKYFGSTETNLANHQQEGLTSRGEAFTSRQLWLSAWIGSALTAFNLETIIWAHTGVSDMLLSGCLGTALLCFFWGYVTSENQSQSFNYWYLGFYIFLSLAVLTKGPVGIVLPGLIICCFLIYLGNFWSVVKNMNLIWGSLIFLLLTLPWYVLVYLENGWAFVDSFFGYHNFQRFTTVVNGHDAPWYFYFLIVLGLFFPWSVYLPLAITKVNFLNRQIWLRQPRGNHLKLFAFFWFICVFIFFTISITKLPSYVLPLMPAASILVALTWSKILTDKISSHHIERGQRPSVVRFASADGRPRDGDTRRRGDFPPSPPVPSALKPLPSRAKHDRGLLITFICNLSLVIIIAIAFFTVPLFIGKDPAILNFKESLLASGLTWYGGFIWSVAALSIVYCLLNRKRWRGILVINLVTFIFFILLVFIPTTFFVDLNRQLPLREIAQTIIKEQKPQEELIMVGFKKPSLVFYTQRSVKFIKHPDEAINYLKQKQNYRTNSSLIVLRTKEIKEMNLQPQDYQQLNRRGVYHLIRLNY